ncbi:putative integral membrane protein [Babesia bovis T2Bo]|uniref:Uncharacterized protein n=1 Tax=Babesia bovis TaxID=5865 RepID=A7ASW6_BABBO|nr:putative integral membrane protein [Babesia bovis T2Bo]EDO06027.1 putative integral membrane protein [Babesia bovis T2Bo]BAN64447.1 hypothetical protein [Babesia bovis]BAN65464.1 hypothetical protein [Babesia bovis]|eukprot:XP_001609595.1 hypothetical protein [Babesia bovis T2Bo]
MAVTARNNGFRKVAKWIVGAVVVASASHGIVMAQEETPKIPEVPEEKETKTEVTEVPEEEQVKTEVPEVSEKKQTKMEVPEVSDEEETKTEVPEVSDEEQTKMEVTEVPEGGDGDAGRKAKGGSGAPTAEPKRQKSFPSEERDWMSKGGFTKADLKDYKHESFISAKRPVEIGENVVKNAAFRIAQRQGKTYVPPEPAVKTNPDGTPAPEADSASADKQ